MIRLYIEKPKAQIASRNVKFTLPGKWAHVNGI